MYFIECVIFPLCYLLELKEPLGAQIWQSTAHVSTCFINTISHQHRQSTSCTAGLKHPSRLCSGKL